ncbi:MAG: hypothetical protein J5641_07370, partial [Bacteroidales bacterium]|nr:hypothetical protein [Bacteroidales bacterium]
GVTPEEFVKANEEQLDMYREQIPAEQLEEINAELEKLRAAIPAAELLSRAEKEGMYSNDRLWVRQLTKNDKETLESAVAGLEVEPDFYYMTREKFSHFHIAFFYLVFFVIVWFHMRHAFPSAFQTLGLYNYKYSTAIEVIGQIYAWTVCLIFAAVVVLVFVGL